MEQIYIKIDGEYVEAIPFIYQDIGHSHIDGINVAIKDEYDDVVEDCEVLVDLFVHFYTKDDLKEALGYGDDNEF